MPSNEPALFIICRYRHPSGFQAKKLGMPGVIVSDNSTWRNHESIFFERRNESEVRIYYEFLKCAALIG